ncbi:hypothetical protein BX600DRAFT_466614 [Xylariales sp. PMI_506]|nr:hypothetical protein BX600DRAFT_466614 [Xylariales sp. PMI_506]
MLSVLLLGATGYVGGATLTELEKAGEFDITCLVRPGREDSMKGRNAKILLGSHAELEKLEQASSAADIVINAADSDDLPLTQTLNRGLAKSRKAGRKGVLVHISGTQLIESAPTGKLENVPKYDDLDVQQIENISKDALHRLIDLEVVRADLAHEIIASIICPGVIYGRATGPFKTISSPFPNIVRLALRQKRAIYAGDGTNIWAHVHVQDVSDLIMLSLRHNLAATEPAGFERFYFAESGEHEKRKITTDLGQILYARGLISEPSPLAVAPDSPNAPSWANRTTARCFANRARRDLGWSPRFPLDDMFEAEIDDILSTVKDEFPAK